MATPTGFPLLPPQVRNLGILDATDSPQPLEPSAIVKALERPIWPDATQTTVFDLVQPGESVCFIVSDYTRKTAVHLVLPVILERLIRQGCRPADFFALIASGIHRPPTDAEITGILGADNLRLLEGGVFRHDPDDDANLVHVGNTRRGHGVKINRRAMEADRLIPIGAALYHYHAGFGGGRKSLVPGIASRDTIAYNHSLTLDPHEDRLAPGVGIGLLDGNPVAAEMLEAARLCNPDISVNTVLTPSGDLAGVFSGDLDLAHREACKLVERISRVNIPATADLVVASAGSASNWIQSHKALFNASRAVSPDGWIVLHAPCPEGIGNEQFRHWVKQPALSDIYKGLRHSSAEVLGQTALSTRQRGRQTILVTSMGPRDVADLGIRTAPDMASAIQEALRLLSAAGKTTPTGYTIPNAGQVVPFLS